MAAADPSHVERIRRALREHAGTPEVAEALAAIDQAHDDAQRALAGDAGASFELSQFAWAKSQLEEGVAEPRAAVAKRPAKTGALPGFEKYEEFDPGWLETLAEYLEHIGVPKPPFGPSPQCLEVGDSASLAVAGDWATGYWRGEDTAAARIARRMGDADYTIHIGDTYYAGTRRQVSDQLAALWPRGRRDAFAIPGNHEMYTKGAPLLEAIAARFPRQRSSTFFALRNAHWLVLALDTAYFAAHMYLSGTLGPETYRRHPLGEEHVNPQRVFVRKLLAERGAQRVILFTHHPPYDLQGPDSPRGLRDEVLRLLPSGPDYWAWGHIHGTAVYEGSAGVPRGRLIGHGAIPYGAASVLANNARVRFAETSLAGDPCYPERVLNGFLRLELDGPRAREAGVGEDGTTRWSGEF